ncbi:MAG: hypothetical protein AAFX06_17525 [Planctomycetota bacterium]
MKTLPPRTGETDLTDDELLLLDMLFDRNARGDQLSSAVYELHMNCGYNHSLDDDQLLETLSSLRSRNVLRLIGNTSTTETPVYSLTESGGGLWEQERRPDWRAFVTTLQRELGVFASGSIIAYCVDEQVGRRCLGAMFSSGMITPAGPIRTRRFENRRGLPWKMFPKLVALRCKTLDDIRHGPKPVEWDVFESSRCWWRSVDELLTLDKAPAADSSESTASGGTT